MVSQKYEMHETLETTYLNRYYPNTSFATTLNCYFF